MTWLLADKAHTDTIKEIERGSDRVCAIVAAAYFEDRLAQTLRVALQPNDDIANRLLKGYGPLATFSAKIDVGHMMGMYSEAYRRTMYTLKDIRNAFAHQSNKTTFKTDKVRGLCSNLPPPLMRKKFELTPDEVSELLFEPQDWINNHDINQVIHVSIFSGRDTPRNRYIATIKTLLVHLALVEEPATLSRRICTLDPKRKYWPWRSSSSPEIFAVRHPQAVPSPNRRRKKRVRPRRPSPP
jgi:hypothetical protein